MPDDIVLTLEFTREEELRLIDMLYQVRAGRLIPSHQGVRDFAVELLHELGETLRD